MKKMTRIFAVLLSLAVLLSMAACGGKPVETTPSTADPTKPKVTYAIKVQDADGNPIVGAIVAICQAGEGGICYNPAATGADGVARFYDSGMNKVPVQDNLKVQVVVAEGYVLPTENEGYTAIPNGTTELTLTLEKAA